ncbi:Ribosomal protein L6 protein [Actinidia chinensis var. chinensis]|uniref:Ribosomal protein L6 protein n=1 Tax=Actinidia chinensis var. chinensis TaxID=1590841 RepID=A0A2R6PI24_ACTCC|nr:Ribosomal protein L6 protein [Actinidia chinensis var. chinensis]
MDFGGLCPSCSRVGVPPIQRKAINGNFTVKAMNGSFTAKKPQPQVNVVPKQRPQTLDSLFANMKEQRMRALSQQNNGGRRNGGGCKDISREEVDLATDLG